MKKIKNNIFVVETITLNKRQIVEDKIDTPNEIPDKKVKHQTAEVLVKIIIDNPNVTDDMILSELGKRLWQNISICKYI